MMRKGFKNINEQTNRMKSLFTDERLYGNLVDKPKVITEQRWLKALSELGVIMKYPKEMLEKIAQAANRPIRKFDDFIRVFDYFPTMYPKVLSDLAPGFKAQEIKNWLNVLKQLDEANQLGVGANKLDIYKIDPKFNKAVIDNFPEAGGIRDMVEYLYWKKTGITPISGSKGIGDTPILPATKGNELVVRKVDPVTGQKIDGDVKIDKNSTNSPGPNAPKEKEVIDIDYEEVKVNPGKAEDAVKNGDDLVIKVKGNNSALAIKEAKDIVDDLMKNVKDGEGMVSLITKPDGSMEISVSFKKGSKIPEGPGGSSGGNDIPLPSTEKGWQDYFLTRWKIVDYINPLTLYPPLAMKATNRQIKWLNNIARKSQSADVIGQASLMKRGAFWSARVITVSSFWSIICGLLAGKTEEGSPCGNVLSAIQLSLTWPFGALALIGGWDWFSQQFCGFLNFQELHNSKGQRITCELAALKMKEIESELKTMTSGEMTKERLESDWGITCEIVTSSQGSDGKVNRVQVEEKIGDKLRSGYEKKITEKLDIVDSNWWQKFIIYLTPLGGFKETILKKNPVNNKQLEEMSNNLIQLCLQNERNQDKTVVKDDQTIVVIHDQEKKTPTNDDNSNSGNVEDQPDL